MTALPPLGFGTFQLTGDDCRRAVEVALEAGYRHVDTAQYYGNEAAVGDALAAAAVDREAVVVATKLWHDSLDLEPDDVAEIDSIDDTVRLGDPEFAPDW